MRTKALLTVILTATWVGVSGILPVRSAVAEYRTSVRQSGTKQVFTGKAVGIGGELGHVSMPFTLEIDGQTSDREVQQDSQILESQGQVELLKAIAKNKLGTFTFEGMPPHDINFVQERAQDKGLSVTVLFEHLPRIFEVSKKTKFEDYPFTFLQFFINSNGSGDGSIVTAAKITMKNDVADTDDFGAYPAHLMNVQLKK